MKWLKNFCGLRGYTLDKSRQLAYGNESGFAVLIQYQAEQPQYRITFGVREAEDGDGAGERLSEHLNALSAGNAFVNFASYKENLVTITLTGKAKKDPENLGTVVDDVIGYCNGQPLEPCCHFCGENVPVGVYSVRGQCLSMCPGCFEDLHNNLVAIQNEKKPVNLSAGIVGALLGSLIGVAVWVIIYKLGYIAGITGFIMTVCCVKGFEKLGGGLNRAGLWASLLIAIVMLAVGEYAALCLDLYSALSGYGYEITVFECARALPAMMDGELMTSVIGELAMGYVFMAVASISYIKQVNRAVSVEKEAVRLA